MLTVDFFFKPYFPLRTLSTTPNQNILYPNRGTKMCVGKNSEYCEAELMAAFPK